MFGVIVFSNLALSEWPRRRTVSSVTFTLLPAVDVAAGRAVRPVQPDGSDEPDSLDPLEAALAWQAQGAEWIHLVDLDAAHGRGPNAELLETVISSLDVPVELSGGVDDDASLARALTSGSNRIVLATSAVRDPAWCARAVERHGERIAIALDVRLVEQVDGSVLHRLAARGSARDDDAGQDDAGQDDDGELWPTLTALDRAGCARYIVTDVSRDGMLNGPNVDLYQAVIAATPAAVIASGGVSSVDDLVALAHLAATGTGLEGAVVGGALYAGRFTFDEALAAVR